MHTWKKSPWIGVRHSGDGCRRRTAISSGSTASLLGREALSVRHADSGKTCCASRLGLTDCMASVYLCTKPARRSGMLTRSCATARMASASKELRNWDIRWRISIGMGWPEALPASRR